jgi:hypothetical protein
MRAKTLVDKDQVLVDKDQTLVDKDNSEPTRLICIAHVKRVGSKWVTHRVPQHRT